MTIQSVARTCSRCRTEYMAMLPLISHLCSTCRRPKDLPHQSVRLGQALTSREMQVAELVAEGHQNKEVAYRLHLTEGTVKVYLSRVFFKMGVGNRTILARRFAQQGGPDAATT